MLRGRQLAVNVAQIGLVGEGAPTNEVKERVQKLMAFAAGVIRTKEKKLNFTLRFIIKNDFIDTTSLCQLLREICSKRMKLKHLANFFTGNGE